MVALVTWPVTERQLYSWEPNLEEHSRRLDCSLVLKKPCCCTLPFENGSISWITFCWNCPTIGIAPPYLRLCGCLACYLHSYFSIQHISLRMKLGWGWHQAGHTSQGRLTDKPFVICQPKLDWMHDLQWPYFLQVDGVGCSASTTSCG